MATRPLKIPPNTADMRSAVPPMSAAQRMGRVSVGSPDDLTDEDRRMLNPVLDPVPGEEVGVEEKKAKVYRKKMASGGYTKAADGCAQRGKTRGKMV